MKQFKFIPFLLIVTLLLGCDDSQTEISASATATKNKSGEIITRDATKAELNSLDDFKKNIERINKKYPRPELPIKEQTYEVISISDNGLFNLENGKKVKMSGIICDAQGIFFVKKFYSNKNELLAFSSPEAANSDEYVAAYIWSIDSSFMHDPETKDIFTGPSYSGMNDTVILNNWCEIDFKNQSKYHNRYIALSEISHRNNK
jgi:hypothetical protein